MKIRNILAVAAIAALIGLSNSAFADDVKTDYDHHANFSGYHTYSWGTMQVADQMTAGRVKRAVDQALQQKGWQMVPSGGDVTIVVNDKIHNEKEAETFYDGMGGGWGGGWGWGGWGWGPGGGFGMSTTTENDVPEGHLIVDMFDSHSKSLLWRGISRGEVSNNPDKDRKDVYEDVDKMFKKFPPK